MLYNPEWKEVEAPIDLSKPSLKGLAYILRHKELWPEGFEWRFTHPDRCAMGLLYKRGDIELPHVGNMAVAMDISHTEANRIFWDGDRTYGTFYPTPEMVAAEIDKYLVTHT